MVMIIWFYGLILVATGVYSYFLIDPNITFFQSPLWVGFRDWAVYLGYYRRDISWVIYLVLLISLFVFHFFLLRKFKQHSAVKIAGLITLLGCVSYPFFSHDLFNYLFDARILTHYGLNPYAYTALDFQKDLWTRFMHWTHRTYPYGPTFLPLTLIPSFLGLGKFSITFFLYKLMNGTLYFIAVYLFNKKNRRLALLFATQPIIVIEGLINAHNDMIAVSLGIIGIYLLEKKYSLWSHILFLISFGIKYITAPLLLFFASERNFKKVNLRHTHVVLIAFVMQIALVTYLCYAYEIQPWYTLSLFVFLPYFPQFIEKLNILFFGLLLSYYPFIRFGVWTSERVSLKREIIFIALFLNFTYFIYYNVWKKK